VVGRLAAARSAARRSARTGRLVRHGEEEQLARRHGEENFSLFLCVTQILYFFFFNYNFFFA